MAKQLALTLMLQLCPAVARFHRPERDDHNVVTQQELDSRSLRISTLTVL